MANGLKSALFGSPGRIEQVQRLTPEQLSFQQQALGKASGLLPSLAQPTDISGITNEIRRRFQTEALPSLTERYTAMGASPFRSSGLAGLIGGAQAGLESQIGSIESQTKMQDINRQQQLLGILSGLGLAPSFESVYRPGTAGFFGNLASGVGGGLGSYLGSISSPLSGLLGGISGLFGGRQQQTPQFGPQQQVGSQSQDIEGIMNLLYSLLSQQQPSISSQKIMS